MPSTAFNPAVHGFRFSNNDIVWSWGRFSAPLCGGMSYAVIDYFSVGQQIPLDSTAPTEGTPLYKYIYDRQLSAHVGTLAKYIAMIFGIPGLTPLITGFSMNPDEELQKLVTRLNTGFPGPVCLASTYSGGHHLVAISCNPTPPILITAYDPNAPGRLAIIQESTPPGAAAKKFTNTMSPGKIWDYLFCDTGYAPRAPAVAGGQENWRWCNRCMGLYFAGHATKGACPRGGPHVSGVSVNYWLNHKSGTGQGDWRWCQACEGLFFCGSGSAGACPKNPSGHDGSASGEYFLSQGSGSGQPNWRWCHACQGLFFFGSKSLGVCPKRPSGHDPSRSGNYFVGVTTG